MKKLVGVAAIAVMLPLAAFQASAQQTETPQTDVSAMFASAQAEGQTMPEFVAKMTELKTCNPKLAEQVVEYALAQAANDPVLTEQVLRAVNTACVDEDTVTTLAIANNIDPALISNALQTATAAGPGAGNNAGPAIAAAPGGVGAGGGTGSGDGSLASGN